MAGWCHLPGPHSMNVHTGLTALTAPQQDPKGAQCTTTRTQTIPLDDPIPPQGSMDLGELALGPAAAQPHALGPAKALSKAAVARSLHLWDNQDPRPPHLPKGAHATTCSAFHKSGAVHWRLAPLNISWYCLKHKRCHGWP